VGIERSVQLVVGEGTDEEVIGAEPEQGHAAQLTRDEITASVHYIRWSLTSDQVERVANGTVTLVVDHPNYPHRTPIGEETHAELVRDLRGAG
jgi:hypothetical protein